MALTYEEALARMIPKDREEYLLQIKEDEIARKNEPTPYGFNTAKLEWDKSPWHKDRPYTLEMWKQLTFKDQQYYGQIEAENNGQTVKINVTEDKFQIEISIPEEFRSKPLSEAEIASFKLVLEREAKKNAYWLMVARRNGWDKVLDSRNI